MDFVKLSVLVVQQNKLMMDLVNQSLKSLGFNRVMCARSAKRAYDIIRDEKPDIILTGWELEDTTGIELIELIRKKSETPNRQCPIILLTGYSSQNRIEQAITSGVNEIIVKPFSANVLIKKIENTINFVDDYIETADFFGPERNFKLKNKFTQKEPAPKPSPEVMEVAYA